MNSKVENYLTQKKNSSPPELSKKFGDLEDFYNKKLWHQLTLALVALVKDPAMQQGTELILLYKNLIGELENKINPLSLAQMAGEVVSQYNDPKEAIVFIEKIAPKVVDHQEAKVLCNVLIANITLTRLEDQPRTKKVLDETEKMLDEIDGVTPVHGKFYLLASDLYCSSGAHADYYRAALRYLGCTDIETLDQDRKCKQAFYLGLAALLGEGIYNFGELLAHPILETLKGSTSDWLLELLYVFNQGNISKFESMRPQWSTQMDLLAKESQLREKIRLLCLMEMTFQRKAWDRQLTFAEIAQETGLPESQVEVMVMRALSLGLVRGTIDQVDSKVNITWVQPRVLDKKQLAMMMERLTEWCKDVNSMQNLLQEHASTILTL
ncbi:26S proteasome non-ATPase regulatory subunit 13 [Halocaridina rubra]|uniref:26S proteasome non-ATPase regulatory subunit 13 n=1 Tax=Halocaridina rubra TaxID=373956 RepID=A0AAN9A3C5_HALRR